MACNNSRWRAANQSKEDVFWLLSSPFQAQCANTQ